MISIKLNRILAMAFGAAFVFALSTQVMAQGPEELYASFYYNKTTGSYGMSSNYDTVESAEERAYEECSTFGEGCRQIVTFQGCGAFAEWRGEEDGNVFGYSSEFSTLKGALDRAMQECMDRNDGYKCGIIMYACSYPYGEQEDE